MDKWTSGAGAGTSWVQFYNDPIGTARTTVTVKDGEAATSSWNMVAVELKGDGD
jgi:hypothetical protein